MERRNEHDLYDRYLARDRPGLYESHYLKANSPDDREAFWIKHNLLVPPQGGGIAEFWLVWFRRGEPPRVWKRERPVADLELGASDLSLRGDGFRLDRGGCEGQIGDASWRLRFSGGLPPLFHFGRPLLYRGPFPRKKLMTPVPNLQFDGTVALGPRTVTVARWIGLRGHNWGSEHAHTYAYGSCNRWDDGAPDRTVDGFTARIRIGPALTPWLSSLVYRSGGSQIEKNRVRDWVNRAAIVEPRRWRLPYRGIELEMEGDEGQYAGLRYHHPGGKESYCYNTKFARVTVTLGANRVTSTSGEHEVLFPEPLPDIPLHPSAGWSQRDGDYQST
ncbi:MAG TPA: hypothetical protein VN253_26285 [Kofleriaceae bacterium]|nr:hypothetical protein [Kofleriaceae bacterium]